MLPWEIVVTATPPLNERYRAELHGLQIDAEGKEVGTLLASASPDVLPYDPLNCYFTFNRFKVKQKAKPKPEPNRFCVFLYHVDDNAAPGGKGGA